MSGTGEAWSRARHALVMVFREPLGAVGRGGELTVAVTAAQQRGRWLGAGGEQSDSAYILMAVPKGLLNKGYKMFCENGQIMR